VCMLIMKLMLLSCNCDYIFVMKVYYLLFNFSSNSLNRIITSAKEVMFLPDFVFCLCEQDNSKSYGRIFLKFSGNVGNGKNYQ